MRTIPRMTALPSATSAIATDTNTSNPHARRAAGPLRVWPAVVLVVAFWLFHFGSLQFEMPTAQRFFSKLIASAALLVLYLVWWLTRGRVRRRTRWLALLAGLLAMVTVATLTFKTIAPLAHVLLGIPVVLTVTTLYLLLARRAVPCAFHRGLIIVIMLMWAAFMLLRIEGFSGDQVAEIRWRWDATPEERFLADRARAASAGSSAATTSPADGRPVTAGPRDWPAFRGAAGDGAARGLQIAGDLATWEDAPPRPLWRQRAGPAWSSLIVAGTRLYTQEQRGEDEAVVCLDANTGRELWAHTDRARIYDPVGGPGPRATPALVGGRIVALGATGILNCLDAATGRRLWSHDLAKSFGAQKPVWGFSASPLPLGDDTVIVYGGGRDTDKDLIAFRAATGETIWTASAGTTSYSSPQRATLEGVEQILMFTDRGLASCESKDGRMLWEQVAEIPHSQRSVQPQPAGSSQVLLGSEGEWGLKLLDVRRSGDAWSVSQQWATRSFEPSFNNFLVHGGHVYGFDGNFFACLDLATGQRRWKKGRYGRGQAILLPDAGHIVVLAESGEVALVAARPERFEELGRFQAIEGKTWNHPVVANGRLYVRNAEEIACYSLTR